MTQFQLGSSAFLWLEFLFIFFLIIQVSSFKLVFVFSVLFCFILASFPPVLHVSLFCSLHCDCPPHYVLHLSVFLLCLCPSAPWTLPDLDYDFPRLVLLDCVWTDYLVLTRSCLTGQRVWPICSVWDEANVSGTRYDRMRPYIFCIIFNHPLYFLPLSYIILNSLLYQRCISLQLKIVHQLNCWLFFE